MTSFEESAATPTRKAVRAVRGRMHDRAQRALAAAGATLLATSGPALAHGYAGARFFPATPSTEDPAVADEFGFPTVSRFGGETSVSGEFAKRLFDNFAISVGGEWVHGSDDGATVEGFANIETSARWRFLLNEEHEALATLGLGVEWGGSGSNGVGEETTVIAPSLALGKGFGDLPEAMSWARPLAATGIVAYERPVHSVDDFGDPIPTALGGGLSLQYSLPYMTASVRDPDIPVWAKRMIPIVEFTYDAPVRDAGEEVFSATIRPGLLYVGKRVQLGAEAIIPANDAAGDKVGFLFQVHWFIDDMFPRTMGRPLWGSHR